MSDMACAVGIPGIHAGEDVKENIREVAEPVIGVPHDSRAWGAVMRRAARARLIEKIGYAPAASSHGSPKPLWKRVPPHLRNLS